MVLGEATCSAKYLPDAKSAGRYFAGVFMARDVKAGAPQFGALLTEQDAASLLRTTPRHVRELRTSGRLSYVLVGRFIRYAPADLDAYIAARRVRASRS